MRRITDDAGYGKDAIIRVRFTKPLPDPISLSAFFITAYDGRVALIADKECRLVGFEGYRPDVMALLRELGLTEGDL